MFEIHEKYSTISPDMMTQFKMRGLTLIVRNVHEAAFHAGTATIGLNTEVVLLL